MFYRNNVRSLSSTEHKTVFYKHPNFCEYVCITLLKVDLLSLVEGFKYSVRCVISVLNRLMQCPLVQISLASYFVLLLAKLLQFS